MVSEVTTFIMWLQRTQVLPCRADVWPDWDLAELAPGSGVDL